MRIKGKISKGVVEAEVTGIAGDECLAWTEKLHRALGDAEPRIQETDEMHPEAEEAEVAWEGS